MSPVRVGYVFYRVVFLSILVTAAPVTLNAGPLQITGNLGVSLASFQYEEFDEAGRVLDEESGRFPELNLALKLSSDWWYISGELRHLQGTADYTAYPASKPPLQSSTEENITDFSIQFGAQTMPSTDVALAVYSGLGYRSWRRDIQSTTGAAGLDEKYEWGYLLVGASSTLRLGSSDRLGADLQLRKAFNARLGVTFKNMFYDPVSLPLDNGTGLRLALNWNHEINEGFAFITGPFIDLWEFDRSADVELRQDNLILGSLYEPASQTRVIGIHFYLSKRF